MTYITRLATWRMQHPEERLIALLISGSLLMGSSIAYPMLSQDGSLWAPVALELFFLSASCFNAFIILEILLYGVYTLVVCVAGMLLILLWGTDTFAHYCRLIPVYTTAASFLTVSWPSLMKIMGYQPRTVQELLRPCAELHLITSMESGSIHTPPSNQAVSGLSSRSEWSHSPIRQTESPAPLPQPRPLREGFLRGELSDLFPPDTSYHTLAPSPDIPRHADTITSISLSSRASWPSEMSSIVRPFFGPLDGTRPPPRETSRRQDINALGSNLQHVGPPADPFPSHPLNSLSLSTAPV